MIELVQLIASSVLQVPFHPDPLPSSSCWLHAFGWIVVASAFQTNHYSQTSKQDLFAKQMLSFFTLLRNCPTKSPMMSYGFTSLKAPETEECVSNWSETRSESIHAIRRQRRTITGWDPMLDAKRGSKKRIAGIKKATRPLQFLAQNAILEIV